MRQSTSLDNAAVHPVVKTRYNPVPMPAPRLGGRYRDQSDCLADWPDRDPRVERRAAFLFLRLVAFAVVVLRAMLGAPLDESA